MGVILDSSVVIAAERRGHTVEMLLQQLMHSIGDQEAALSAIGVTELVHGIYRARTDEIREVRRSFVGKMLRALPVYPYDQETAELAGRIDAQQRVHGITIPFADLLIGVTALALGFSLVTTNLRHFQLIPQLSILPFLS